MRSKPDSLIQRFLQQVYVRSAIGGMGLLHSVLHEASKLKEQIQVTIKKEFKYFKGNCDFSAKDTGPRYH